MPRPAPEAPEAPAEQTPEMVPCRACGKPTTVRADDPVAENREWAYCPVCVCIWDQKIRGKYPFVR